MRNRAWVLVVVVAMLLAASADARRKKCRRTERRVDEGVAILGGPGLGFEVIRVNDKADCFKVLSTTEDGAFALIELEKEKAGWVPTGLVDEGLSETATSEVSPLAKDEADAVFVTVDLILRDAPRFDAKSVSTLIQKGTRVAVEGQSADAQWLYVNSAGVKGWVPKYQVDEAALIEGSDPTAGSGGWAGARAGRTSQADAEPAPAMPDDKKAAPPDGAPDQAAAPDKAGPSDPNTNSDKPAPPEDPVLSAPVKPVGERLGQQQELNLRAGYAYWQQTYNSDAAYDPFARYTVAALAGGRVAGRYTYRGAFPVVGGIGAYATATGFGVTDPDTGEGTFVLVTQMGLHPELGWRLVTTPDVDLEAGAQAGLDVLVPLLGPANYVTVPLGLSYTAGPFVRARARLLGGTLGLLSATAGIAAGGYTMLPLESDNYYSTVAGNCDAGVPVDKTVPPGADVTGVPTHPNCPNALADAFPPLHLNAVAEFDVAYAYPVLDFFYVGGGFHAQVRQASIRGGGIRNVGPNGEGAYSEASNLDVTMSVTAGATFVF